MRIKSKVIEIPTGTTPTQMETSLDNWLNKGWIFNQVFVFGTKTYAMLTKKVAE